MKNQKVSGMNFGCGRRALQLGLTGLTVLGLAGSLPAQTEAAPKNHPAAHPAKPAPIVQHPAPAANQESGAETLRSKPKTEAAAAHHPAAHTAAHHPGTNATVHASAAVHRAPVEVARIHHSNQNELNLLAQAHTLMVNADHDYAGHRAKAVHEVKEAARLLGRNLGGDPRPPGEAQAVSDQQLQQAAGLLTQVQTEASARRQPGVLLHVNNALGELNVALSIR